jgi:hypothetical protein
MLFIKIISLGINTFLPAFYQLFNSHSIELRILAVDKVGEGVFDRSLVSKFFVP